MKNLEIEKKTEPSNRVDALLALRSFACLIVVISHCNPPRNGIIYKQYDLSWLIFSHGGIGVWIFFCLSGYLMGKVFYTQRYTINVPGVINFWRNRILRIFPLYYFAVLILSVFVYSDILKIENWGYLLRIITFTYNNSLPINWNGAMWSLSTELQFYLLVPFIYTCLSPVLKHTKNILITAIVIIILIFIARYIVWVGFRNQINLDMQYAYRYWYTPLITNLDCFLLGFLVNSLIISQEKHLLYFNKLVSYHQTKLKVISIFLLIILYLVTAYHLYHQELFLLPNRDGTGIRTATSFFIWQPLTALITSFFIFVFEYDVYHYHNNNGNLSLAGILKNPFKSIDFFGNVSYGVYLWHIPVFQKISPIFTTQVPIEAFYAKLNATLIISILLATVTYYIIEVPFGKRKMYTVNANK
ncbi:putative acyltransferase domain protein [Richelia sinica FACHB-800]|uniref:Acyltransferase domain protein n=1 Tax=Richelia sinica FACHB-800 TaxID=1357546 RepID=A0A975T3Y3_9NOST|nr:acyltransferase [Richelia sinica]QXE21500.1 putative acyltransferase domain protein [Richelia sinica FACHB-800]